MEEKRIASLLVSPEGQTSPAAIQQTRREAPPAKPEFILLITGTQDNDAAAENAAGSISVVHHKLAYVPPYQRFEELKKLQLKVRRSPASVGKRICAAIDLYEWVGHENDEFFIASVKFFHDMCGRMKFVFTVGDCNREEAKAIYFRLRIYMNGCISEDPTFRSTEALAKYIESRVADRSAAELIAEMLMNDGMRELRSCPAVNRLCYDMRAGSKTGVITSADVSRLLRDENSLPCIINSEVSLKYRELADEITMKSGGNDDVA